MLQVAGRANAAGRMINCLNASVSFGFGSVGVGVDRASGNSCEKGWERCALGRTETGKQIEKHA
jgi:hypothetical protein